MKKKLISLILLISLVFNLFYIDVFAATPTDSEIVDAAAKIIVSSEGWYSSVNADDNGALSIGCIQWHANRALNLLKTIVNANKPNALSILGETLYNEILNATSWTTRILTDDEADKISKLISTTEGIAAQDALLKSDISNYVSHGRELGIVSPSALVYFADIENQCGGGGSARIYKAALLLANGKAVDLDTLHQAALADAAAGKFASRRNKVYNYAFLLGWDDIAPTEPYEVWKTNEVMNVRTGAGLSYDKIASIAAGTNIIIYERVAADGYIWGRTTTGWIATDYCSFVTGNIMYYATFDVNGGNPFAKPLLTLDVDKVNEPTLNSLLQIYTDSFGSTTGTPVTQHEIRVDANGVALNATANGTGNTPIPEGGFVINASGAKYTDLSIIVRPGHYISFNQSTMKLEVFTDVNAYLAAANPLRIGAAVGKLPVPTHSDPSLYFSGWYTDNGTKIAYGTTVTTSMTPTLKLYAHWSSESGDFLPVTFDANGGVISTPAPDNSLKVTAVNSKRLHNYVVVYDSSYGATSGTNKYGTEVQIDASGKAISAPYYATGNLGIPEGGFVVSAHDSGTADSNCTALMQRISINSYVYFDRTNMNLEIYNSYDNFSAARKKVSQGRPVGTMPTASKDGFIFTGWYDKNGNLVTADTIYTSDMDTTFTAGWSRPDPVTVTLTLDANGGSFAIGEMITSTIADGLNTYRDSNMLVVYNNDKGEYTNTNKYGVEAAVDKNGIIIDIQSYVGSCHIPSGGFVLSGHDDGAEWILNNLSVGMAATFDYTTYEIKVYRPAHSSNLTATELTAIGSMPVPSNKNLYFLGWYTSDGKLITENTISDFTKDATLYAKWSLLGDIDKNDTVNEADMSLLKTAIQNPLGTVLPEYDLTNDGLVNMEDYFALYKILNP